MNDDHLARKSAPQIIVIDRDAGLRRSIRLTLQRRGYEVRDAGDENGINRLMEQECADLVVIDQDSFPEISGQLIEHFRRKGVDGSPHVVLTTGRRVDSAWRKKYRPDLVLYKPLDIRFLYRRIKDLL